MLISVLLLVCCFVLLWDACLDSMVEAVKVGYIALVLSLVGYWNHLAWNMCSIWWMLKGFNELCLLLSSRGLYVLHYFLSIPCFVIFGLVYFIGVFDKSLECPWRLKGKLYGFLHSFNVWNNVVKLKDPGRIGKGIQNNTIVSWFSKSSNIKSMQWAAQGVQNNFRLFCINNSPLPCNLLHYRLQFGWHSVIQPPQQHHPSSCIFFFQLFCIC